MVRRARPKNLLEAYRKLHFQGLMLTPKHAFAERAALWQIQEVTMDKLVEAIDRWEERLDLVQEQQGYELKNEDKVQGLLLLCPSSLRAKLLEDQGRGMLDTFEGLKEEILFRVTDILDNGPAKKVFGVSKPEEAPGGDDDPDGGEDPEGDGDEWPEEMDTDTLAAIGAAYVKGKGVGKGKGKGKGKGGQAQKAGGAGAGAAAAAAAAAAAKAAAAAAAPPNGTGDPKLVVKGTFEGLCWWCCETGHRKTDCPAKAQGKPKVVQTGQRQPEKRKLEGAENPWAKAIRDRAAAQQGARNAGGPSPMQIGGVAVPEAVLKAIAGQGRPSLPGLGAVSKVNMKDEDGYEQLKPKKTVRLADFPVIRKEGSQSSRRGSRFRVIEEAEPTEEEEPLFTRIGAVARMDEPVGGNVDQATEIGIPGGSRKARRRNGKKQGIMSKVFGGASCNDASRQIEHVPELLNVASGNIGEIEHVPELPNFASGKTGEGCESREVTGEMTKGTSFAVNVPEFEDADQRRREMPQEPGSGGVGDGSARENEREHAGPAADGGRGSVCTRPVPSGEGAARGGKLAPAAPKAGRLRGEHSVVVGCTVEGQVQAQASDASGQRGSAAVEPEWAVVKCSYCCMSQYVREGDVDDVIGRGCQCRVEVRGSWEPPESTSRPRRNH